MYGARAATACREAVEQSHSSAPTWSEEGCRTFQSVVEEFFNMKVGSGNLFDSQSQTNARA